MTAINACKAILRPGKTVLLMCDLQERFSKAMFKFDSIIQNASKMVNAMKILDVPVIVTEQSPKSLGKTVPEIDISCVKGPFPKSQFSMLIPEVKDELSKICCGEEPESVVLMGLETHVCVEISAIDLRQCGYEVHIVADCCTSRTQEDRMLAFKRMQAIGCHIATSENVIFKLLGGADHKEFKNIQNLVKAPTQYTGLVCPGQANKI